MSSPAPNTAPQPSDTSRTLSSAELLRGETTLVIEHQGMRYTLRATRSGKLILTK